MGRGLVTKLPKTEKSQSSHSEHNVLSAAGYRNKKLPYFLQQLEREWK